jgi:hypothetical protein
MKHQLGWRRINGIVSAILVCFFLSHATLRSVSLLYPIPYSFGFLVWVGIGLIAAHAALSIVTSQQMLSDKIRPPSAKKKRHLVLKWLSGLLFLLVVALHVAGVYGGFTFSNAHASLVVALLLVLALAAHTFIGTKSLLKDLDVTRRLRVSVRLVVGGISLIIAVVIIVILLP